MTRGLQFQIVDLTKPRKIDMVPDCRESYTSFAEAECGWMVTVPAVVDIKDAHTATWAPNTSESQGFASSCWEVGPAEPPQSYQDEWWADHAGSGNAYLSDHDIAKNIIGVEELPADDFIERAKRQRLEELRLEVMAQNPSYLGVPGPMPQEWKNIVEEKLYGQSAPARKGFGERLEREGYGQSKFDKCQKAYRSLKLMEDAMTVYHESRAPEEERVEYVCPISGMVHWIPRSRLEKVKAGHAGITSPLAHGQNRGHVPSIQEVYVTPAPLQHVEVFAVNSAATNSVKPEIYGLPPNWEPKVREGLPKCEQKFKRMEMTSSRGDLVVNEMQAEEDAKFFQTLKSGYGVSVQMSDCDMSFDPGVTQEPYKFEPFPSMDLASKGATLPGANNLGELDDAQYFRNKLFNSLCFPKAALEAN